MGSHSGGSLDRFGLGKLCSGPYHMFSGYHVQSKRAMTEGTAALLESQFSISYSTHLISPSCAHLTDPQLPPMQSAMEISMFPSITSYKLPTGNVPGLCKTIFWKMNQNLVKMLCELHSHFIYLSCLAFKISDVR